MTKRIKRTIRAAICAAVVSAMLTNPCAFAQPAAEGAARVVPGGEPFGIKLSGRGPVVAGFCDLLTEAGKISPARDAGVKEGDVILRVGDETVKTADDVVRAMNASGEKTEFTVLRDGDEKTIDVRAVRNPADGKFKAGILIRDVTAGIGTVTFTDPETGAFMGLGHGVCDPETGELSPMTYGAVCPVTITGAVKGEPGDPGELTGKFLGGKNGVIKKNTPSGVFGYLTGDTEECSDEIEIAGRDEVCVGEAYVISTVGPEGSGKYSVTIEKLPSGDGANFEMKVTDPVLLGKTGGIVRGMSGSPVIQNGKLVGAVTHVMINDPTRGYGIFIDEMLKEAA